jgi:hypothetical protein
VLLFEIARSLEPSTAVLNIIVMWNKSESG